MIRRFQFSLRAIFKATTLLAALCAACMLLGGPAEAAKGLASAFHFLASCASFGEVAASVTIYMTALLLVCAAYVRNTKADARQPESPFANH